MKRAIVIMGGAALSLFSVSAIAQETPAQPAQPTQPVVKTWESKNNPTVDSIRSKYAAQYIAPKAALTSADVFPVIGQYESATNPDAANVTVSLDESNKGVVWIDGLPQGRIKAMLRKSPGTYKIPAQKTADDKSVEEGTLIFDKETNTLSIAIGKEYNAADPAAVFAIPAIGDAQPLPNEEVKVKEGKVKSKKKEAAPKKAWVYTGTKVVTETVAN